MCKNTRKKVAEVLVLLLLLTVVMPSVFSTEVQAAPALKLSKKKVTISVGETAKIKVKKVKAKKIRKLTVKVNKKKIVAVKKSGKTAFTVIGKKTGKTTITVKVKTSKKTVTLKAKVTVKRADKKDEKKTLLPTETPNGVATNESTVTPSATSTVVPTQTPMVTPHPTSTQPFWDEYGKDHIERFDTGISNLWCAKPGSSISFSEEASDGTGALLVTGNQDQRLGVQFDLTDYVSESTVYTIVINVKAPLDDNHGQEDMKLRLSGTYRTNGSSEEVTERYFGGTDCLIERERWILVADEFVTPQDIDSFTYNIEAVEIGEESFLIDDFYILKGHAWGPCHPQLPSLKDTYAQVGLENFGVVVTYDQLLNENVMDFTKSQYSSVTLPKQMAPDAMIERENTILADSEVAAEYIVNDTYGTREANQDAEGNAILPRIDFTYVDKVMKLAQENGLKLRYSTLLDEAKIPAHFYTEGYSTAEDAVVVTDADVLSDRKEMYVRTVMNHILNSPYVDTLYAVDVVRDYMHGENAVTDSEEVKNAFIWAYDELVKAGKTEQISLFYSDYNTYEPGVAEQIIQLINHVNSAGKICAGVAMQSHFDDEHATVENFEMALQAFAEQDYEIQITELRVTNIGTVDANTDHEEKLRVWDASAEVYSDIMTAILRQRREGANISSVTLDSLTDATSEKEDRAPVLFGMDLADKKPAFDAVINAASDEQ